MTTKKFTNRLKDKFLINIPVESVEASDLIGRCKFNFSYWDMKQEAGSGLAELTEVQIKNLVEKIRLYSRESLSHWQAERCGSGGLKVLEIYGEFPKKSDFVHPKSVPHDVRWARFRMDNLGRLVGFLVPAEHSFKKDEHNKFCYDCNTFYVVFVDLSHRFYKVEKK
ncbi:TPA: hypothetical protein L4T06_005525 [Pseudomonas aeruginosa]|nr:hypothetical protein [Pseudomonas aeruginosa]